MRKPHAITRLCLLATLAAPGGCWGPEGHRAVGMIAQGLLTPAAANAVRALLGDDVQLADVSTCADEVRGHERGGAALSPACAAVFPVPPKGTATWHYINIPIPPEGPAPEPTDRQIDATCHRGCVLQQINRFSGVLRASGPATARKQALAFLVHFVGDLHQPLHAVARHNDEGGNLVQVIFFGKPMRLHAVWDSGILGRISQDENKLVRMLQPQIEQARAEPHMNVEGWARQSFDFARTTVYAGIPLRASPPARLGEAYQAQADPVVRLQLARAGVRLANLLNELLR